VEALSGTVLQLFDITVFMIHKIRFSILKKVLFLCFFGIQASKRLPMLSLMNEFSVLKHIFQRNAELGDRILIQPGDDMGMVQVGDEQLLVAVDQVVGGRHVQMETTPLKLVGRKAVMRSLSDIAAMAGQPVASLVAGVLPLGFTDEDAAELFDAMREAAMVHDCPVMGGDLGMHGDPAHPLVLSVTVLACPGPGGTGGVVTRRGAEVGDGVYVTGQLGGSLEPDGGGRHLTFEPRIEEALALQELLGDRLHAMIDISDGLGRDAGHLARASGVMIHLEPAFLPCHSGVNWRGALGDGEDYELCFAANGDIPSEVLGVSITKVGEVRGRKTEEESWVVVHTDQGEIPGDAFGWEHHS